MAKVWLITGSSRGLGNALAKAVLNTGDRVVATARNAEQLAELVNRYGRDHVHTMTLDVTDPRAAEACVAAAVDVFGHLDVVVNNAGYANIASIEEADEADFRRQFETNFFGAFHVTRAATPVLRRQRRGHIIQISSVGGRIGSPGLGAYQSSKWALEGLSEVLAKELAPLGINVTLVEPGGFRTDWAGASMQMQDFHADYDDSIGAMVDYRQSHSGQEKGDPDKAARAIVEIAAHETPPLRLLLGSDAVFIATQKLASMRAVDEQWRNVSLSTDFDDSPAARRDNLARLKSLIE